MEKQYALESSYGIMRVREVLKEGKEKDRFDVALSNILDIYYNKYYKMDIRAFFNPFGLISDEELRSHFEDISIIYNTAKKNRIYMDRPNDKISSFIYGAAKILL